eukprot:912320-Lingulodinium_polyedra.AAC.1
MTSSPAAPANVPGSSSGGGSDFVIPPAFADKEDSTSLSTTRSKYGSTTSSAGPSASARARPPCRSAGKSGSE